MARAVDASMDLLKQVQRDALEPEYAAHARRVSRAEPGEGPRARRIGRSRMGALGVALVATLVTLAAVQTSRQAPAAADEHDSLVRQIQDTQSAQAASRARIATLDQEIRSLQAAHTATGTAELERLASTSGATPVTGPGVVVTVDDGDVTDAPQVSDQDMRQLVNGLWAAHAEAVAVNGHRVTARTAIRQAGSAITVDYVSLTRPYRVEAIGNPTSLAGDFAASASGRWWAFLHSHYGISYQVTNATRLDLPGDATLTTTTARAGR